MEKLLLIGIDTRSMLNSALKLDYDVYSTSYFSTSDTPTIKNQKIILNESDGESCGIFEDQFSSENILDISKDYLEANKAVKIRIKDVLSERIKKGGDIEASAEFI